MEMMKRVLAVVGLAEAVSRSGCAGDGDNVRKAIGLMPLS